MTYSRGSSTTIHKSSSSITNSCLWLTRSKNSNSLSLAHLVVYRRQVSCRQPQCRSRQLCSWLPKNCLIKPPSQGIMTQRYRRLWISLVSRWSSHWAIIFSMRTPTCTNSCIHRSFLTEDRPLANSTSTKTNVKVSIKSLPPSTKKYLLHFDNLSTSSTNRLVSPNTVKSCPRRASQTKTTSSMGLVTKSNQAISVEGQSLISKRQRTTLNSSSIRLTGMGRQPSRTSTITYRLRRRRSRLAQAHKWKLLRSDWMLPRLSQHSTGSRAMPQFKTKNTAINTRVLTGASLVKTLPQVNMTMFCPPTSILYIWCSRTNSIETLTRTLKNKLPKYRCTFKNMKKRDNMC